MAAWAHPASSGVHIKNHPLSVQITRSISAYQIDHS
jgi:hypothetical protein